MMNIQQDLKICMTIGIIALLSACKPEKRQLHIYGNKSVKQKIVNGKAVIDTIYQTIPDFSLLNQDSACISNKMFDGKIYIADFFFTSCPSICPVMHSNMLAIYNQFKENKKIKFLSHSIDFKYDRPSVLKAYAKNLGITDARWQFVCGSKEQIYTLAERNYFYAVETAPDAPGGYAHSGYLILVDKYRRVRGAYLGIEDTEVKQLIQDIQLLLNEQ